MKGEKKERWMELCEQAAREQDDEKFCELISEITRQLQEKEDRLKGPRPALKGNPGTENAPPA
jgi:hypothetical protein